jgi:hypothetical protein
MAALPYAGWAATTRFHRAAAGSFFSITGTADELSVVCKEQAVPEDVRSEKGWRCLRVAGVIPFTVVGLVAALTTALAEPGISIFVVSTFDTDNLLVKETNLDRAMAALRLRGHHVQ